MKRKRLSRLERKARKGKVCRKPQETQPEGTREKRQVVDLERWAGTASVEGNILPCGQEMWTEISDTLHTNAKTTAWLTSPVA